MLDSLVRVSRRVAAYADLLGREWPTAVQVDHVPGSFFPIFILYYREKCRLDIKILHPPETGMK